ncbi:MAG: SDR family NAD(P)-dependent oxidoreductase [Flavobacteriales bacterium]|nr:SDR family NAD(P)-dependent oxidoreductase [Flavobacteriales bacterium]
MNVKNKKVLITGGGSGIGLAIMKQLLDEGASVIIAGRNKEKLEQVKTNHPEISIEVCDVSDLEQVQHLANKLTETGGIDILINNSGVFESINYANGTQSGDAGHSDHPIPV